MCSIISYIKGYYIYISIPEVVVAQAGASSKSTVLSFISSFRLAVNTPGNALDCSSICGPEIHVGYGISDS